MDRTPADVEQVSPQEARVLAALMEKAATTPDNYPLSTNALVAACNQSTNRDPVMSLTEREVDALMLELRTRGLARTISGSGHRVGKHRHIVDEALGISGSEAAVLAVLLLRGPQTLNELTTRTARYAGGPEGDVAAVDAAIDTLAGRPIPLAARLARQPGEREPRIDQRWSSVTPAAPAPPAPDPSPPKPTTAAAPNVSTITPQRERRRVALIVPAASYVGPHLARALARCGHDLVLGRSEPNLVSELEAMGATVVAVDNLGAEHDPDTYRRLVDAALERFGQLDAACLSSGSIVVGSFLRRAKSEDLDRLTKGLLNAPFEFLQAVSAPMVQQRHGQILVFTSSSGAAVTRGAPLYSGLRAGANHMIKNIAAELAPHGVQLNVAGTNYMNFPGYWEAVGGEDPERRAKLEAQVPMARMGELDELAELARVFLDGSSRFMTGQIVNFDGGWSAR